MGTPITAEMIYEDYDYHDAKQREEHHNKVTKLFEIKNKEKEENRNVPGGSEGTLNYIINVDSKTNVIGEGTNVYIHGDLRDVMDADKIIDWLNRIIKDCLIRDLVVKVECEYGGGEPFLYMVKHLLD